MTHTLNFPTSQFQNHSPFSLWLQNAQLDLTSHSIIRFVIDNFSFSCISFLHSSLTFLQATLSNVPLTSVSDNRSHHHSRPATQNYLHTCQCFSSSFPFYISRLEMPPSSAACLRTPYLSVPCTRTARNSLLPPTQLVKTLYLNQWCLRM